jgi:hypothetical protein
MENPLTRVVAVLALGLSLLGCRQGQFHVAHITNPEYPLRARFENLQGTVTAKVIIGADGKVTYAGGSGAPDVLVKAAEENAQSWVFGPFPPVFEFPAYHTIQYVYKLDGKATVVAPVPIVKTFLPDRIEISATPLVSDYPPLESYHSVPKERSKPH